VGTSGNKESKRKETEARGGSSSSSTIRHRLQLRLAAVGTPVSSSPLASSFQIELLQEHCAKVI